MLILIHVNVMLGTIECLTVYYIIFFTTLHLFYSDHFILASNQSIKQPLTSHTYQMWYPCGSFKGDEKSAALCQSYADNGLLSSISKNQLDAGVGGSLYRDLARLEETIVRGYPQLRKDKGNLEFGYKLSYKGLTKEQEKIQVVEVKEQKGFLDGLKNVFGGN